MKCFGKILNVLEPLTITTISFKMFDTVLSKSLGLKEASVTFSAAMQKDEEIQFPCSKSTMETSKRCVKSV